ncbi:zeta toxin family protein [Roseateles chitinivorans]|uniref:zeta toxin family protein n=1 Tax=Roseateles chitinivorans TaxID=2917965 RepID=UPI003D67BB84
MLAGPNGSGKSTIKRELKPQWIGVFINADEIERTLRESEGRLDLASLGITATPGRVLESLETHIRESAFARKLGLHAVLGKMCVDEALMLEVPGPFNSYLASVLADAIRRELLDEGKTFTFETVMSSGDKVDFMREARERGYRVYLYFVATKDPAINVDRVKIRVKQGGHPVPEDKIRERYVRSIDLLTEAATAANRAYVFDNSADKHKLLVQVIDGESMEIEAGAMPRWFTKTALWQSFNP